MKFNKNNFEENSFYNDEIISEKNALQKSFAYLISVNIVTSGISLTLAIIYVILFYRFKTLRNSLSRFFCYLTKAEIIYLIGKLFSFGKYFSDNHLYNDITCHIQSNIILYGEILIFTWAFLIAMFLNKMLIDHEIKEKNSQNKCFLLTLLIPILPCLALELTRQYPYERYEEKGIKIYENDVNVFCWIRLFNRYVDDNNKIEQTINPVPFVIYFIYIVIICTYLYYYFSLRSFLNSWSKLQMKDTKTEEVKKDLLNRLGILAIIYSCSYGFGLICRIITTTIDANYGLKISLTIVSLILCNTKVTAYFFFCIDKEFRDACCHYIKNRNFFFCFCYNIDVDKQNIFYNNQESQIESYRESIIDRESLNDDNISEANNKNEVKEIADYQNKKISLLNHYSNNTNSIYDISSNSNNASDGVVTTNLTLKNKINKLDNKYLNNSNTIDSTNQSSGELNEVMKKTNKTSL